MLIRPATDADANAIWAIMEPIVRAGETYTLPRNWTREPRSSIGYLRGMKSSLRKRTAKLSAPIFCKQISKVAVGTLQTAAT